ncbi:hypothetical protein ABN306_02370 [Providencia huaxiensis]|uniref:Uncharacterized protein n=1 Tax=Providencia huaxiensis TaxID=2027290 RepID=A0A345LVI1_9GAMM|nr:MULTISPECIES: hypothetical protein [Providencia]AXH62121.1 hypothetical protein CYG50_08870 [Providencia huaxiensis]MBN6360776.1 hypothetical protein [Providencia huaxiensis]MBQ0268695.1 hypothetical protein [Providencia huaxiensis]MBQ0535856.1 hypothetical protein [Providencia huaxiensis]MBQ0590437.1 hypothetical protein [Providencia huaxiensis]
MKRINRYQAEDFITTLGDVILNYDEVTVSQKHDIVIGLEPEQVDNFESLKGFIVEISKAIPDFDNQVQRYFYHRNKESDFPHNLNVIYIEGNTVILDYWSEMVNNQFTMTFQYNSGVWKLIDANGRSPK